MCSGERCQSCSFYPLHKSYQTCSLTLISIHDVRKTELPPFELSRLRVFACASYVGMTNPLTLILVNRGPVMITNGFIKM